LNDVNETWQRCVFYNSAPLTACPVRATSITDEITAMPSAMLAEIFANKQRCVGPLSPSGGKPVPCISTKVCTGAKFHFHQSTF
jgi:hypothetical protein